MTLHTRDRLLATTL